MPQRWGSFEIGGTFGGTAPRGRALGEAIKPISYSESGADGRIRTGDPLFTKQLLCQLSYVGVRTDYMRGFVPARKGSLRSGDRCVRGLQGIDRNLVDRDVVAQERRDDGVTAAV